MLRIILAFVVLAHVAGCSRRDDGTITAEPDRTVHAGMPVIFVSPGAPSPEPAAPVPNPLAMPLKHDGPALGPGAVAAAAAPIDPCAPKEKTGPLAMRLRHDGQGGDGKRNPLCMRLK